MTSKGQKSKKWSFEEKLRIVKRHTEKHVSVKQLAKEEGADHSMICHWVREYEEAGEGRNITLLDTKRHFRALIIL